jgi:fluoride exporter
MVKWLSLIVGSSFGGVARHALSSFVHRIFGTTFPHGTLVVNLSGCFLIGLIAALSQEKFQLSPNARLLFVVGFCGAFTTFSTFIFETAHLASTGETMRAFANILLSVTFGFLVFRVGVLVGDLI